MPSPRASAGSRRASCRRRSGRRAAPSARRAPFRAARADARAAASRGLRTSGRRIPARGRRREDVSARPRPNPPRRRGHAFVLAEPAGLLQHHQETGHVDAAVLPRRDRLELGDGKPGPLRNRAQIALRMGVAGIRTEMDALAAMRLDREGEEAAAAPARGRSRRRPRRAPPGRRTRRPPGRGRPPAPAAPAESREGRPRAAGRRGASCALRRACAATGRRLRSGA